MNDLEVILAGIVFVIALCRREITRAFRGR